MDKQLTIKTSDGGKAYKISNSGSTWYCYRYRPGFFSGWDSIGKTRSMEDAITFCRSHASQYGRVHGVEIG